MASITSAATNRTDAPSRVPVTTGRPDGSRRAVEVDAIEILDTEVGRLAYEEVIDVGAEPVRVGQLVARARGDEQLVRAIRPRVDTALPVSCLK